MNRPDLTLIPPPSDLALFLDFDGTLVPFADRPEDVIVPTELPDELSQIGVLLNGALAIITGRPMPQIDRLLNRSVPAVASEHGAALRFTDGREERMHLPDMSAELELAKTQLADHEGVWIEEKSAGFAVHYRLAPHLRAPVHAVLNPLVERRPELHLLDGNHVFELRAAMANKGAALNGFMEMQPFEGRIPVFIGDDTTDEDAFEAAQRRGGVGIKVGKGETCATLRWDVCSDVHRYLAHLARQ